MESVHFNCYKISLKLPLDKIDAFFNLHKPVNWKDYVILDGIHLRKILQHDAKAKMVYLFKYGCVCFVNFNANEIDIFLRYMDSIIGGVDFFLFSKFNEDHTGNTEYAHVICFILAKSVELNKLETDMEGLLDKSERLIDFLQSGKLHINRKLSLSASRILRLEYHYANNVGIFERDIYNDDNIEARAFFDRLSRYYELDERQKVMQSKMDDMRNIFSAYSSFSYNQRESRTLWFEIALLSLFPTAYVLEIIPYKDMISRFLRVILP